MKNYIYASCSVLACILLPFHAISQHKFTSLIDSTHIQTTDSGSIHFHSEFTQFLRNDEYFSPIVEGYTLLGASTRQGLIYYPSAKTRVYAGVEALSYWGDKPFVHVLPDFNLLYRSGKGFQLQMGSLVNETEKDLAPLISNCENIFAKPLERGIDILFDKKLLKWNAWLAWQQFLKPYEHSQEIFVIGQNLEIKILNTKHIG